MYENSLEETLEENATLKLQLEKILLAIAFDPGCSV